MTLLNISGSSVRSSGTSTGAKAIASAAGTNSAGSFNLSLEQVITGDGSPNQAGISDVGMLLEGLLQNAMMNSSNLVDGEQTIRLADLLNSMLGDTDQLDDAIAADPSLAAELQGWIQQLTAFLSAGQQQGQQTAADEQGESTLSPLAANPGTLRFAIQDGLAQLASLLQKADMKGQDPAQAAKLLTALQHILNQSEAGSNLNQFRALLNQLQSNHAGGNNAGGQSQAKSATAESGITHAGVQMTQEQGASDGGMKVQHDDVFQVHHTVTAGQLVIKDGIGANVKSAPASFIPMDNFAKEMNGFIINKLDFVTLHGRTEAKISLYPEHLGQVDIKLTMQNGQLVAQFSTEHAATKQLLEQQMSQLRTSLQSQGVQVERLVVTQNQSLQSQMYHDGRQPGAGQQQQQPNRRSKEKDASSEDALTVAEVNEELNEWMAEQQLNNAGGTFTAKA